MASNSRAGARSSSSEDENQDGNSTTCIQDARERRVLRSSYRKIINDLQGGSDEEEEGPGGMEMSVDQSKLQETIERVNDLFIKVSHPREAALDSQVYSLIARSAKNAIQTVKTNVLQFEPQEFMEALLTHFGVDRSDPTNTLTSQNWIDLSKETSHIFATTPAYHFFYGTFDPGEVQPKPATQRRPRAPAAEGSQQRPTLVQEVRQNENQFEEKTSEQVEHVYETLKKLYEKNNKNALCFFRFSCDPASFSQTIENIFHISFLVKDDYVRVFYDEYGLPVIEPLEKGSKKGGEKLALAMGMSMAEWKAIVDGFKITSSAITRKK